MDKIANPQDLQTKIRRLLAYAEGPLPRRETLALELRALANKVAGDKEAGGDSYFYEVVDQKAVREFYDDMSDEDEQAGKLFYQVMRALQDEMELSRGAQEALNRVKTLVGRGKTWDAAMKRNFIFKAAHSLGIKLPSGMF